MKRVILRSNDREWCQIEISLQDGRLSVCGIAGDVVSRVEAKRHRLEVHARHDSQVLAVVSCGQIVDELRQWFPEAAPLLPWHLNDMRADCEHQEKAVAEGRARYSIGEPCETCGYNYGHAWLRRELPADIIELAKTVCADEEYDVVL